MLNSGFAEVTNFIPKTTLERKRAAEETPRLRSSTIPKPLERMPAADALPTLNFNLTNRQLDTLQRVAKGDVAEHPKFKGWALATFPEDIKPSELYQYFVYLLEYQKNHPSLVFIAMKLKEFGLDRSLDPNKVSALAKTVFANPKPFIPQGVKLTDSIITPHLEGLDSALIRLICSFMKDPRSISFVNRQLSKALSNPQIQSSIRAFLEGTNPAMVRWIESLNLPTINWLEINHLMQQPNFLSPTRECDCYHNDRMCLLSDGCLAFFDYHTMRILQPKTGTIELVNIADKIQIEPGEQISSISLGIGLPSRCVAIAVSSLLFGKGRDMLMIYDIKKDKVMGLFDPGGVIASFAVTGGDKLVLELLGGFQIRDLRTGQLMTTISDERVSSYPMVGLSNGLFATINNWDIHIWDSATGKCNLTLKNEARFCRILGFIPNGNLVSHVGTQFHVWDPTTGNQVGVVEWPEEPSAFKVLPYDLIVTADKDGVHNIIRMTTGELVITLKHDEAYNPGCTFVVLPDGSIVSRSHSSRQPALYDQIPNLIAAATRPIPQFAITQPMSAPQSRAFVNSVQQLGPQQAKVRLWVVLAVLVSALVWNWLRYRN